MDYFNQVPIEIIIPFILFIGSIIYGTFGFGDALFAMPLLSMIIGVKMAAPLMTINGLTLSALMFFKHYKNIDWKITRKLLIASFIGVPAGIYFLKNGNEELIKIVLGVVIISVSVYNLFIKNEIHAQKIPSYSVYFFGFFAGVLGGAFNSGGPSIVIFGTLSNWSPIQFISNLQGYFMPNDIYILVGQYISGILNKTILYYYAISLPFVLLALAISSRIRNQIEEHKFNRYVHYLLLIIGVLFLVKSILFFQA